MLLAGVGAVLPGIPTVGPLLLGSFFLTKSSPALEKRLIRNRFFARYLPYLDGSKSMSNKARITSILMMWCSIGFSVTLIYFGSEVRTWLIPVVIVAGMIGTVFIWRFSRDSSDIADESAATEIVQPVAEKEKPLA